jgi:hypothetical protein
MNDLEGLPRRPAEEAAEAQQALRALAHAALDLGGHLVDYWPVRGDGPATAGPPTHITFDILEHHLLALGRALDRFLAPAEPTARSAWRTRVAAVLRPAVTEGVSKLRLVYGRLVEQFGSQAPYYVANSFGRAYPPPSVETSCPWQPPDGRPVSEIDPQDIRTLAWGAAVLFRRLGEETRAESADRLIHLAGLLLQWPEIRAAARVVPPTDKPAEKARGKPPRMLVASANEKAMELAKQFGSAFFVLSEREQARRIGCSPRTWTKTPFYERAKQTGARMRAQHDRPGKGVGAPSTVSYTRELDAVTGDGERDEVLKKLAAEQEGDYEPSPLDACQKKVYRPNRRL